MGWHSETYYRRAPITVVNTAGAATMDVDIVVPPEWDEFWEALAADGDTIGDILRVTNSNGVTLLNYDVDNGSGGAWSTSTKTGRIRIDGVSVDATANTVCCFWVYFDTQAAGAADASVAVTMTSIVTGYIDLGSPTSKQYALRPPAVGRTTPQVSFAKGVNDSDDVWIGLKDWVERGKGDLLGHTNHEEPKNVVVTAYDSGGSLVTTVYTVSATRWAEVNGALWLRVQTTAGTDATNYTITPKITTIIPNDSSNHRVFQERFGLRVKNVLESA